MAAAQRKPDQVVIVDLDLQFGQVATYLNVVPRQTLADVVRDDAALREPELLRTYATKHDSGLHVLAAPTGPETAGLISADHVDRILTTLLDSLRPGRDRHRLLLDERTLGAFEHAETILFVVNPDIAALKAMTALARVPQRGRHGRGEDDVRRERHLCAGDPQTARCRAGARHQVGAELPYDPFLYLKAVNEGVPIVLGAPRSAAAQELVRLSTLAFGPEDSGVPAPVEERKSGGLFSFRRR